MPAAMASPTDIADDEHIADDEELVAVAPLLPFLIAPILTHGLQSRLAPLPRALTVGLVVAVLSLVVLFVLRRRGVRAPRRLGPITAALVLGAIAAVGATVSSFLVS